MTTPSSAEFRWRVDRLTGRALADDEGARWTPWTAHDEQVRTGQQAIAAAGHTTEEVASGLLRIVHPVFTGEAVRLRERAERELARLDRGPHGAYAASIRTELEPCDCCEEMGRRHVRAVRR